MDNDDYMPRVHKVRKAVEALEGDTIADKAKTIQVSKNTLYRVLSWRAVKPHIAKYVSSALKMPLEELFWR